MENALPWNRVPAPSRWRDLVMPKEHGSWSLALEPLAFGLIAAPSVAGGWLAAAVVAAFFARRPLRIAFGEPQSERGAAARMALMWCSLAALAAVCAAVAVAGLGWLGWLLPAAVAGAAFLSFDLRNAGREETAEVAGAAAFALLPAAFAALAGARPATAVALALVMCGRAVPTVLTVRSALRAAKTGVRHDGPAIASALGALTAGIALAAAGVAPWMAAIALGLLGLRTFTLLVYPRPVWRARTIGMIEAVLGLAFVVSVGAAWHG
jgi:hypothetical protein